MAYFSQEMKKDRALPVKAVLKKYNIKGSLGVRNHSTFVLNIKSGPIDFIKNFNELGSTNHHRLANGFTPRTSGYINVNPYHFGKQFSGRALKFLSEVFAAMNLGNHDNSDIQTDYFDVGFYVDVNIGQWDQPYNLVS